MFHLMNKISFLILFICFVFHTQAQKTDKNLQKKIQSLVKNFHGDVGLYVKNLNTGKIVTIRPDSLFPTASMVKVPILIGIMDKLNKGELSFHQQLVYNDSLLYPGVDILGSFKNGEKIELSKLIMLMLTMSDNTASRWLQALAGTGERINNIMDSAGFTNTKVNSKTPGRESNRQKYGWGQTTPREMATLLEKIYFQQMISPAASTRMLRFLNRNYWDGEAVSQVPPYAAIYSKSGALDEYRSEVVLVKGIKSAYVFCIVTNNNKDTSWTRNNEAWMLIRNLSGLLWNYYEPSHQWQLPPGSEKFY
jgi:beta-lactamase class A